MRGIRERQAGAGGASGGRGLWEGDSSPHSTWLTAAALRQHTALPSSVILDMGLRDLSTQADNCNTLPSHSLFNQGTQHVSSG